MKKLILLSTVLISIFGHVAQAQTINTIAGGGTAVLGDDSAATLSSLGYVGDVTIDDTGNIYIADAGHNRIRKISKAGIITSLGGGGSSWFTDGMPASDAPLPNPLGVAIDKTGNIFVAVNGGNCVQRIDPLGKIHMVAGNGTMTYTGDGGPGTAAGIFDPEGVCVDTSGNVYIADQGNAVIRKVDKTGIITTFAGGHGAPFSGDGGPATDAGLGAPNYISADKKGNFYITDGVVIRKINNAGIITTIAGDPFSLPGYTGDGGPAMSATFDYPRGNRADTAGNVYIADWWNNVIRKIDTKGIITTIAGNGYGSGNTGGGFSGDGGLPTLAELYFPTGIALDPAGNMYIADGNNSRIRRVYPKSDLGAITTTVANNSFSLLPDPNNGSFILHGAFSATATGDIDVSVTNMLGQVVYTASLAAAAVITTHITLDNAAAGTYLMHISTGSESSTLRFVINR